MHINLAINIVLLNLNRLGTIALLGVEFASVHGLDVHHIFTALVLTTCIVRCRDNGLPSGIEAKVCLIHELLIEARVDSRIVVRHGLHLLLLLLVLLLLVVLVVAPIATLLEQFVQNGLLLLIVDTHAFTRYCATTRSKRQMAIKQGCWGIFILTRTVACAAL